MHLFVLALYNIGTSSVSFSTHYSPLHWSMEPVHVTEIATLASARWMLGRGKKTEANDAATQSMQDVFDPIQELRLLLFKQGIYFIQCLKSILFTIF